MIWDISTLCRTIRRAIRKMDSKSDSKTEPKTATRNAALGSVMNFLNRILESNEDMISEKVRETEYDVNQWWGENGLILGIQEWRSGLRGRFHYGLALAPHSDNFTPKSKNRFWIRTELIQTGSDGMKCEIDTTFDSAMDEACRFIPVLWAGKGIPGHKNKEIRLG